jgi:hypothetical protein
VGRDVDDANEKLGEALMVTRASWELETTARNLAARMPPGSSNSRRRSRTARSASRPPRLAKVIPAKNRG